VRYFSGAKVLGVTATPDRNDKRCLGQYFESLAYEYTIIQAIRDGWLAPIRALSIPLKIDLNNVAMQNGDFKAADLDDALAPYMTQIADEMVTNCKGRKSLVFVPLVATAKRFAEVLTAKGFRAQWVSGDHPDRSEILKSYASGEYDVLVNSMLLTEGYDDPETDCIVCLRPTKSRSLYAQIVGRGTRIHPGKKDLLLLDFLWQSEKHELCRPANLISDTVEMAKAITKATETAGGEGMLIDDAAITAAQQQVIKEREAALAAELRKQRAKKARLVDPLQWAVSVNAADLADYQPEFGWEMSPASKQQLESLEKAGISPESVGNAGMASKLLDRLESRKRAGFATPRQVRCLERFGFKHVGEMTFVDANKMITRISSNAWRVPDDINPKLMAVAE
jgi:superfamily II DNA or RNA helicase